MARGWIFLARRSFPKIINEMLHGANDCANYGRRYTLLLFPTDSLLLLSGFFFGWAGTMKIPCLSNRSRNLHRAFPSSNEQVMDVQEK